MRGREISASSSSDAGFGGSSSRAGAADLRAAARLAGAAGDLGAAEAVIAVEFARRAGSSGPSPEDRPPSSSCARHHRLAEPGDLQLDEAGGRIELALIQHPGDDLPHAADREVLDARDMRDREPAVSRSRMRNCRSAVARRGAVRRGGGGGGGSGARDRLRGLGMGGSGGARGERKNSMICDFQKAYAGFRNGLNELGAPCYISVRNRNRKKL